MITNAGQQAKDAAFKRFIAIKARFPSEDYKEVDRLFSVIEWKSKDSTSPASQIFPILTQIQDILKEIERKHAFK